LIIQNLLTLDSFNLVQTFKIIFQNNNENTFIQIKNENIVNLFFIKIIKINSINLIKSEYIISTFLESLKNKKYKFHNQ